LLQSWPVSYTTLATLLMERKILTRMGRKMTTTATATATVNATTTSSLDESVTSSSSASIIVKNINVPQDELIEMIEPNESLIFTESQQHTLASLFAGVGSGMFSSVACAPLDLVRTRMQVLGSLNTKNGTGSKAMDTSLVNSMKEIISRDGVRGCFRGLGATLVTVPTFWGIYFPLYEMSKTDFQEMSVRHGYGGPGHSPLVHMSAAIFSGAIADFFCNPLFVVRTRMQTEALHYMEVPQGDRKPHSMKKTIQLLHREGGYPVFWRGFTASLLGLSHVGIQFPVYEFLKAEARSRSTRINQEESPLDLLLASGLSKMIATTMTYPHEVVRSRLMDYRGTSEDHAKQTGLVKTFKRIVRQEGWLALYSGIHVSLVRVLPNCCITFMTYEMILRYAKGKIADSDYSSRS